MGLASISWNSVRVFSKLRNGLFRVLYHAARFGTAKRIAYAHSICGHEFGSEGHQSARNVQNVAWTAFSDVSTRLRSRARLSGSAPASRTAAATSQCLCISES